MLSSGYNKHHLPKTKVHQAITFSHQPKPLKQNQTAWQTYSANMAMA